MTEKMSAKEYRKNRNLSEYDEQVKLANYLDAKGYLWCHVPNGGNRDAKTGAKMKRQGVKPGVPDVLIFENPMDISRNLNLQSSRNIAIELKRENGSMSDLRDTQREWLLNLKERGWFIKVAFGADDAIDWLEGLEGKDG